MTIIYCHIKFFILSSNNCAFIEMLEVRPEKEEVVRNYQVPLRKVPEIYVA